MRASLRLGRHSNRSQHALDPSAAPNAAAVAVGGGTGGAIPSQTQQSQLQNQIPAQQPQGQSQAQSQNQTQVQSDSPAQVNTPHSALSSNTTFSSSQSSFADARSQHQYQPQQPQQQAALPSPLHQHQHQQQPPPPPQHQLPPTPVGGGAHLPSQQQHHQIYAAPPEAVSASSPVADANQQPDWIEAAVIRSQSQRYSTYAAIPQHQQQHQQHLQSQGYGIGSASLEDLPSTGEYNTSVHQPGGPPHIAEHPQGQGQYQQHPQAAQPEKKSRRKLIKGIFSSKSNYDNHHQHHHQPSQGAPSPNPGHQHGHQAANSYDNTAGLARRPSKRQSNPPVLNTRLAQPSQPPLQGADWAVQGHHGVDSSPHQTVGGFEERHSLGGDSQRDAPIQEGLGTTTIRQVNNDSDSSPYDDTAYHQAQQAQQGPVPHQQQLQQQLQPNQQQQQQPQHQQSQHQQNQAQYPSAPPSQPHVLLQHQQAQSHRFDQSPSDQQPPQALPQQVQHVQQVPQSHQTQQQHPYAGVTTQHPFSPRTDSRYLPGRLATNNPLQQSHESLAQPTQDYSPAHDSDYGHTSHSSPAGYDYSTQPRDVTPTPSQSSLTQAPTNSSTQQSAMAPPTGAASGGRRAAQDDKAQAPLGPPPGYRQPNAASSGTLTPLPQGHSGSQPSAFNGSDQGRHSPQPERDAAEGEKAFKDLLTKYKNVKRLYFDGKAQIENLTSQVEQLQNAVANQRMSQSRTALDDNEYAGRFNRLNGAINNLSFNIRKDWRTVPPWLERYVSTDALKTGKQEMTAVGRAVISKWLVDELFDSVFHPGLEPSFSNQLKDVELSIRGNAYTMNSQEEFDALTTKIVQWRMATLDGLHKYLQSQDAADNRQNLTTRATSNLTACLYQYLSSPPPPGVDSSASTIVELAIGIVANLPMESRDVVISYPLPESPLQPSHMEVEKGELPAPEGFGSSSDSDDDADKDKNKNAPPKEPSRVRFAGFVTLEVRGRQVLMKAPVWTL